MKLIIRAVALGYKRIFPELLDRFHRENDQTIIDLIAEKAITKMEENYIDVRILKEEIVDLLKKGI